MFQVPPHFVDAGKRIALDVWLNLVASHWEERYTYVGPSPGRADRFLVNEFKKAIVDAKPKQFRDKPRDADDMLSAFEHLTKNRPREYALVALSDVKRRNRFRFFAVSEGTSGSVMPPLAGIVGELNRRAKLGIKSRLLMVHNHPQHPLKAFLEKGIGMPLGPSTADRELLVAWSQIPHVTAEFYLYESKEWRRFTIPHFKWLLAAFETACAMFEWAAQKVTKNNAGGFQAVL